MHKYSLIRKMIRRSQDTMKHFFFSNDKSSNAPDILNYLLDSHVLSVHMPGKINDTDLKAYYDVTDIIYDKRFDQGDEQLKKLFEKNAKNPQSGTTTDKNISNKNIADENGTSANDSSKEASAENTIASDKKKSFRLRGLELLWEDIEKHYKIFTTYSNEKLYKKTAIPNM